MLKERHGYYDREFSYLEMHIGEEVTCVYWSFGTLKGVRGILNGIDAYDSVIINNKKIKFLGERTAIYFILLENRIILYSNSKIRNYTGQIGHFYNLIKMQNDILGYSVIEENLNILKNNLRRKL